MTRRTSTRYEEVERIIRETIAEVGHGGRLPGEVELAERLGVSRGTVRKAMDRFVAAGTIERRTSRGTVVRTPLAESNLAFHAPYGFRSSGHHINVYSAKVKERAATAEEAADLELERGGQVHEVSRRVRFDDEPFSLNISVFPSTIPLPPDLTRPWSIAFAEVGIHLVRFDDAVSATAATATVARALGVDAGSPVLAVRRVSYDDTGAPIETAQAWLRTTAAYTVQHKL